MTSGLHGGSRRGWARMPQVSGVTNDRIDIGCVAEELKSIKATGAVKGKEDKQPPDLCLQTGRDQLDPAWRLI